MLGIRIVASIRYSVPKFCKYSELISVEISFFDIFSIGLHGMILNRKILIYSFYSDSNKSTLSRLDSEPINQTDQIGLSDKRDSSQGCRYDIFNPAKILSTYLTHL